MKARIVLTLALLFAAPAARAQIAVTIPAAKTGGDTVICLLINAPAFGAPSQACFEVNPTDTSNILSAYGSPCAAALSPPGTCTPQQTLATIAGAVKSDVTGFVTNYLAAKAASAAAQSVTPPSATPLQ